MQPGAALQAMLLTVLLAKPRDSKGHLLSGECGPEEKAGARAPGVDAPSKPQQGKTASGPLHPFSDPLRTGTIPRSTPGSNKPS